MSILKSSKKGLIGSGIAFAALGVLMCIRPIGTAGLMCVIAGAAMMLGGLWKALGYFRKKEYGLVQRTDFAMAALQTALGALLISRPEAVVELMPVILGMVVLVNSVFQGQNAAELKALGVGSWKFHLIPAAVCALAAIGMMFNPFDSYRAVSFVLGAAFIIDGINDLLVALYLMKKLKKQGLI